MEIFILSHKILNYFSYAIILGKKQCLLPSPLKHSDYYIGDQFHILNPCTVPTQYIYVFWIITTK
jgi:hypothetical protein